MKKQFTSINNEIKKIKLFILALNILTFATVFAQPGAAIKLDGSGDLINLGSTLTNSLNGGNKITIEAWVNTATNSGAHGPIIGNHQTNVSGAFSFLLRRENAHHVFWVGNNTNQYATVSLNTSTLNTWIHLACVWNGTTASVYVNGVLTASTNPAMAVLQNTVNHVYIGGAPLATEHFNGMIDEVRVWNVARTKCEINTFKNCEIPNNTPGLLVNYHFNQGIAAGSNTAVTSLIDATSNNLTGTLTAITLTGTSSNWVAPGGVVSGFTTALAGPSYSATSLSVCSGNTLSLASTGATSFSWAPTTVTNNVAFTPSVSTNYTITNSNSTTGCSNTAVASVTVNNNPNVVINSSSTNSICAGQSVSLTVSGANSYTWSTGSNATSIVVSPTINTGYSVSGNNTFGCNSVGIITVSVSTCTGIQNINKSTFGNLAVYPNPSNGILNIELENAGIIEITDVLGRIIVTEQLNAGSSQLKLGNNVNGVYFVKATVDGKTKTVKIVKE